MPVSHGRSSFAGTHLTSVYLEPAVPKPRRTQIVSLADKIVGDGSQKLGPVAIS